MYDEDGDGYIDFKEFMMVLYIMSAGTPEENLGQIFRIFDKDNDGSISEKEMVKLVKDLVGVFEMGSGEEGNEDESASPANVSCLAVLHRDPSSRRHVHGIRTT